MAAPVAAAAPAAASAAGSGSAWATLLSSIAQGGVQGMGAAAAGKGARKQAREAKRKTYADLLNSALQREADLHRSSQEREEALSLNRAKLMQEMASQFRQSII